MPTPRNTAWRVLVVDDEPLVCDSIEWMFAVDGHQVETATSGKQALAMFETGKFAVIIVDYDMPGMNGDELAAAIKARDPNQPIVMITAYPEMLASSGNPLVGVDLVLNKPFGLQELRKAVSFTLAESKALPPMHPPVMPRRNDS